MAKHKNVIEKFTAFVAKLSEEDACKLWRVLTALRGPDSKSYTQKHSTIAIRNAVWPANRQFMVPASFIFRRESWSRPAQRHYHAHIRGAVRILEELGYKLPITLNKRSNVVLRDEQP